MLIDGQGDPILKDPWVYPKSLPEEDNKTIPLAQDFYEYVALPLSVWQEWDSSERQRFLGLYRNKGLLVESDIAYDVFLKHLGDIAFLQHFALVALKLPILKDGRVFSLLRRLREKGQYKGELRILGDFLTDQLHFLKRCGADSFALGKKDSPDDIKKLLSPFSHAYQVLPKA